MAGLFATLRRPTNISSSNFQSSSVFAFRLLYLLTVISVSLAVFAYVLQWRGGLPDPTTQWIPGDDPNEAGSKPVRLSSSSSGCADILGQSRTASFPYFRDWKFDFGSSPSGSDLRPKVCFYQVLFIPCSVYFFFASYFVVCLLSITSC